MKQHAFTVLIAGIAQGGMEDYVNHFLTELMEKSRQDPGCLNYTIHQSTSNPGEFLLYSTWENEAAFNQHNETPHMREFKEKLLGKLFEQHSPKTYWTALG